MDSTPLMAVENLTVELRAQSGALPVVRNAAFSVKPGRWLGLVGESGSGKSILALSILRLLPPAAAVRSGRIFYQGSDLLQASEEEMEELRGENLSVVFQNALSALNPLFTAGEQVADIYRHHHQAGAREAQGKAIELFASLGLSDPERTARMYLHQLSGGMAQRVMLAMALICSPRLLIADDPTSTLDATIQAQVLDILVDQVRKRGMSMLLISRDIRLVSAVCPDIAVMRQGEIVEAGSTREILGRPAHPYTGQLLEDADLTVQTNPPPG
jgi:ABC-type dipeptide/oligopeptide/nickel transport system ATPase component